MTHDRGWGVVDIADTRMAIARAAERVVPAAAMPLLPLLVNPATTAGIRVAEPAALLLAYGRRSQWTPVLTGSFWRGAANRGRDFG